MADGPLELEPLDDEAFEEAWALLEQEQRHKYFEELLIENDEEGLESLYEEYLKMQKELR